MIDKQLIRIHGWEIIGQQRNGKIYIHDRRYNLNEETPKNENYNIFLFFSKNTATIIKEFLDENKEVIFNGLIETNDDFTNLMRMLRLHFKPIENINYIY